MARAAGRLPGVPVGQGAAAGADDVVRHGPAHRRDRPDAAWPTSASTPSPSSARATTGRGFAFPPRTAARSTPRSGARAPTWWCRCRAFAVSLFREALALRRHAVRTSSRGTAAGRSSPNTVSQAWRELADAEGRRPSDTVAHDLRRSMRTQPRRDRPRRKLRGRGAADRPRRRQRRGADLRPRPAAGAAAAAGRRVGRAARGDHRAETGEVVALPVAGAMTAAELRRDLQALADDARALRRLWAGKAESRRFPRTTARAGRRRPGPGPRAR